ncbi:hypothetical protein [Niveispirillum fermenti]|uniref:hypothetical protein n=1 Tax=Niveispirillum fermenti TaxID=1233113 RepID=UPI003A887D27
MTDAYILDIGPAQGSLRALPLRMLFDAWTRAIRPGDRLPRLAAIDPTVLAVVADRFWSFDLLPSPVPGGRPDFRGRIFGAVTIASYQMDPAGRLVSEFIRMPVYARIFRVLSAVAGGGGQPVRFAADQSVMSDGRLSDVEALGLPVTGDDGVLSGIIGATYARGD